MIILGFILEMGKGGETKLLLRLEKFRLRDCKQCADGVKGKIEVFYTTLKNICIWYWNWDQPIANCLIIDKIPQ